MPGVSLPSDWPDLNIAQRAAVTASMEPQLVVAGPGTGKTRVLVCRAAYLIDVHEPPVTPSELVLVTFTRRAAHQLTNRLTALVGPEAQHVRAGTIHHFCYETLREYAEAAEVPDDFIVVDDTVADAFWQRWYEAHEEWCEAHYLTSYRQVKTRVSRIKLGIDAVSGPLVNGLQDYNELLAERGALDFDDLLTYTRDLLRDRDEVRNELTTQTQAVLVDEFQDTDPVQYDIIRRLGDEGVHLYCVADDDQSVYRFRGARPANIRRYIDHFGCRTRDGTGHVLNTNYRSNRSIFQAAEAVLDAEDRLKRRGVIETWDSGTEPVHLVACENTEAEHEHVLHQIQEWINAGAARSELAVLTRWNNRLADLEQDFLAAGVACESSATEALLDTPPAEKLHALLRVVDARRRNRSVEAAMNDLLERMLPEGVMARVREFGDRSLPDAGLWTVFQTIVSDQKARASANLDQADVRLDRIYATLRNLLQKTDDGITIGEYTRQALRQVGDPLQLLSKYADRLVDPGKIDSFQTAGAILAAWQRAQASADPPRLLLHHRTQQITRLWRQLARRALGLETDPPAPIPEAQEALFLRTVEEGIPPLGSDDVVVTTDLEALVRWAERFDAFPDDRDTPRILLLDPGASLSPDQLRLLGMEPEAVKVVDPSRRFHSPSVRLFKLLQVATGPTEDDPLFPEYVMVDIEATGTDPRHCRVAEIGALKVVDGEIVGRFSELVELPDDLTDDERDVLRTVCGLDPDSDFDEARPEDAVWDDFCSFVGTAPIVAYNGQRYDFRVLRRLGNEHEAPGRWATTYDLLPDAHDLFPDLRRYSAEHLREVLLDDPAETAHRALADCEDQQRILEHMQTERTRRHRILAHEPLLPLLVAALTYEAPDPDALSDDAQAFLQVGHTWALRDASPAGDTLRNVLPRALPDRVRQHELYRLVDEEALLTVSAGLQPGLASRLDALFEPYTDEKLHSPALEDLLTHLALWGDETNPTRVGGDDVVTLSTYHSAKGLEFERVVCMDVHNNAFPPYFARDPEERKESRRLLYVGMTRAKRRLVLTYPKQERGYTRRPSPFLDAVPTELLRSSEQEPA